MEVLNSDKLLLRIGCSIMPCIQSVSNACNYCIDQPNTRLDAINQIKIYLLNIIAHNQSCFSASTYKPLNKKYASRYYEYQSNNCIMFL